MKQRERTIVRNKRARDTEPNGIEQRNADEQKECDEPESLRGRPHEPRMLTRRATVSAGERGRMADSTADMPRTLTADARRRHRRFTADEPRCRSELLAADAPLIHGGSAASLLTADPPSIHGGSTGVPQRTSDRVCTADLRRINRGAAANFDRGCTADSRRISRGAAANF